MGVHLHQQGVIEKEPEQIIVNEYYKGQVIGAHTDHPIFGETIVIISLVAPTIMHFTIGDKDIPVYLDKNSIAYMKGEVRNK
jgi:alkylated DNA repair dioxygenase AlkB